MPSLLVRHQTEIRAEQREKRLAVALTEGATSPMSANATLNRAQLGRRQEVEVSTIEFLLKSVSEPKPVDLSLGSMDSAAGLLQPLDGAPVVESTRGAADEAEAVAGSIEPLAECREEMEVTGARRMASTPRSNTKPKIDSLNARFSPVRSNFNLVRGETKVSVRGRVLLLLDRRAHCNEARDRRAFGGKIGYDDSSS